MRYCFDLVLNVWIPILARILRVEITTYLCAGDLDEVEKTWLQDGWMKEMIDDIESLRI